MVSSQAFAQNAGINTATPDAGDLDFMQGKLAVYRLDYYFTKSLSTLS